MIDQQISKDNDFTILYLFFNFCVKSDQFILIRCYIFYFRGIDIIEHVRSDGINVGEDV